jgi:hypothetical protein
MVRSKANRNACTCFGAAVDHERRLWQMAGTLCCSADATIGACSEALGFGT